MTISTSRSSRARHGFTEAWQERLERIGLDQINFASLTINYRTPAEVMAEAELVIRAVLPDANVPVSVREGGVPVMHGSASDRDKILHACLAAHAEGVACVIGDLTLPATRRVRSLSSSPAPDCGLASLQGRHAGNLNGSFRRSWGGRVVAPAGFVEHAVAESVLAGTAMGRRAGYMYGRAGSGDRRPSRNGWPTPGLRRERP